MPNKVAMTVNSPDKDAIHLKIGVASDSLGGSLMSLSLSAVLKVLLQIGSQALSRLGNRQVNLGEF